MVMRLTTVLCWVTSFKNRCSANRWNNDGAVRLIMCSRQTAVSSKKDDGSEICFKCDPRRTLMEGTTTDYALAFDLVNEQSSHDYEPLWTELKQLGGHRAQYSLWPINVN